VDDVANDKLALTSAFDQRLHPTPGARLAVEEVYTLW
jgi:hypothetical protein